MKKQLPDGALEILLKEHSMMREEINERLKTAFTQLSYAGAIGAFAFPAAGHVPSWASDKFFCFIVALAIFSLFWIARLNMQWVLLAGAYVAAIEKKVNDNFGEYVLGWEHYANYSRPEKWYRIPQSPKIVPAPIDHILRAKDDT